ncbi:MAG: class I SAM-dependent methyltransferase [Trueperaceae bacterium]|nr:class I SAM-dependent methyltransferase [Trueperaceae bacterium]
MPHPSLFNPNPKAWQGLSRIPWHDEAFSQRMLREHLDQGHDRASRRFEIIDKQVAHLAALFQQEKVKRVLDLGCGPGFYAERLSKHGFEICGIDISPAATAYAKTQARKLESPPNYLHTDLLAGNYGNKFDAALFIFGELNAFSPQDALTILQHSYKALKSAGVLVLEVHTADFVKSLATSAKTWSRHLSGLFADEPYLQLHEAFWDEGQKALIEYFHVLRETAQTFDSYVTSLQAYSQTGYQELLTKAGFERLEFLGALDGGKSNDFGLFELRAYKT